MFYLHKQNKLKVLKNELSLGLFCLGYYLCFNLGSISVGIFLNKPAILESVLNFT